VSTTLVDAREAMYQRFSTQWGSTTPVAFDNEKFEPPVGTSWVRVSVRHQTAGQETLQVAGNRQFLRGGEAVVQVFAAQDRGTRAADLLAQQARAIFEGVALNSNGIRFTDVLVREIGESEGWYQVNVEATFQYQERK
jgi:uncharacterized protein DUF4128